MRKIPLFLAVVLSLSAAGCASQPPRTATANKQDAKDEYVWYTPTGSHIPVRIRKSELLESENTKGDQEAMRDIVRRGLRNDRQGD